MADAGSLGIRLEAEGQAIDVEWDAGLLRAMAAGDDVEQPWRLEGEIDWDRWHSLSVLSAGFEDGGLLAFAALRPRGAAGHDADVVQALHSRGDADPAPLDDVLISTQRDAGGELVRINLEASEGTDPGIVRAAGDIDSHADAEPVQRSFLAMRMAGSAGFGTFDVLSRP